MSAPDPTSTLARTARIIGQVSRALHYAPEPVADALRDHEGSEGNEWTPISCPSLIGDAAYYAGEDRPALVLWMSDGDGFMFLEGHPDDARYSADVCSRGGVNETRRAWWCTLTDDAPEWREAAREDYARDDDGGAA